MSGDEEAILGRLLAGSHLLALEDLPAAVAEHASSAGFTQLVIYVADLRKKYLVPLPGQHDPGGRPLEALDVDTTIAGKAFRTVRIVSTPAAVPPDTEADADTETGQGQAAGPPSGLGPWRLWVPLLDGTERIGVLGATVSAPGTSDTADALSERGETIRWWAMQLASLIALMIAARRHTSDTVARLMRTEPLSLSAEVLWAMLPPRTYGGKHVVVSTALEPAYHAGGDAYDYAAEGPALHLAIFDSMGHDTAAGLTTTIALASYRNTRRCDVGLPEAANAIDEAIAEQFPTSPRFATGILARLDTTTGHLTWVNRGHPPLLVLRRGGLAAVLQADPDPPMGLSLGSTHQPAHYHLEPGDRLLLYTDGIVEARNPHGNLFGLERFTDFIIRREADGLTAPETLRRLIQTILTHHQDRLSDDATVLMVEWRARHPRLLV